MLRVLWPFTLYASGMDDAHYGPNQQEEHVGQGGRYLREFADGLGPEALDRIAYARAGP